ncbi:MAG TPA: hypothetical protein ENJ45_01720, partial [Phaeodactylibacter sp.]|nr:hypothetical protein [Phaeodactylibacter sp.]
MKLDLAPHIGSLLFQHDTLVFPDLGGLVSYYKPASIDYVQGILYPPSKTLVIDERMRTNDGVLEHFIRTEYDMEGAQARQALADYIQQINEALDRGEIVLFPKVGRLYKNYERRLQFLQENTNFNKETYGLPSIQFYPILRSKEADQVTDAPLPIAKKKMVGKPRSLATRLQAALPLVLSVGIVAIALSLYFLSPINNNDLADGLQTLPVANTKLNRKPKVEHTDIGSGLRQKNKRTEQKRQEALRAEEQELLKEVEEINSYPEKLIDTEGLTYQPTAKEAIIIIGAFSKKSGVRRSLEKIYDLGYDAYQEKKGRLTRVGIQLAYEDDAEVEK